MPPAATPTIVSTLLLYLAVEGSMHSRSKLTAFLWPDSDPQDARAALRTALALLRNLLADASPAQHSHLLRGDFEEAIYCAEASLALYALLDNEQTASKVEFKAPRQTLRR